MRRGVFALFAAAAISTAISIAPGAARAGDDGALRVVEGGPKQAPRKKAALVALGGVRDQLAVCMRGERPAKVRVAIVIAADGAVTSAAQRSEGPVAQCVAGILAVQNLGTGGGAYSATVEVDTGSAGGDLAGSIAAQLAAARQTLDACQKKDPTRAGALQVKFTIAADGSIGAAGVADSSLGGSPIEGCVVSTLGKLRLAAMPRAVKYSLRLDFAGAGAAAAATPPPGRAAPLPVEGATKEGPLSVEAVREPIDARAADFRACYKKEQKKQKGLAGTVTVRFTVRPDGTVKNVKVKESTLGNAAVETCLVGIAGQLRYAPAASGEETKVVFPFVFRPE